MCVITRTTGALYGVRDVMCAAYHNNAGGSAQFEQCFWDDAIFKLLSYRDNDGVQDNRDNCVFTANSDQLDTDLDGLGKCTHSR